jgi:hypothetical protein
MGDVSVAVSRSLYRSNCSLADAVLVLARVQTDGKWHDTNDDTVSKFSNVVLANRICTV